MPTDYAVHELGTPLHGMLAPAPVAPSYFGQAGLAEATDSAVISVTVPSVLVAVATAKLRIDIEPVGTALDAAASPNVLPADLPRFFFLRPGSYRLRTAVYA